VLDLKNRDHRGAFCYASAESTGQQNSMKHARFPVVVLPNTDDDMSEAIELPNDRDCWSRRPAHYATDAEWAEAVRDGYAAPPSMPIVRQRIVTPEMVDPARGYWATPGLKSTAGHWLYANQQWRTACDAELAAIRAVLAAERGLDRARRAVVDAQRELQCANRELSEERRRS
jgi:hypothetical protein